MSRGRDKIDKYIVRIPDEYDPDEYEAPTPRPLDIGPWILIVLIIVIGTIGTILGWWA